MLPMKRDLLPGAWGRCGRAIADPQVSAPEPMLPEGVSDISGRFFADCCVCERRCDVTEFMDEAADIDFTRWHGGCGPACCP